MQSYKEEKMGQFKPAERVYYKITQKETGRVLDGNSGGSVYSTPWNGGDWQEWVFDLAGDSVKHGANMITPYKITQKETGRVLDGNSDGDVYSTPWNGGDWQKWYFDADAGDESYRLLAQWNTGNLLDGNDGGRI